MLLLKQFECLMLINRDLVYVCWRTDDVFFAKYNPY